MEPAAVTAFEIAELTMVKGALPEPMKGSPVNNSSVISGGGSRSERRLGMGGRLRSIAATAVLPQSHAQSKN